MDYLEDFNFVRPRQLTLRDKQRTYIDKRLQKETVQQIKKDVQQFIDQTNTLQTHYIAKRKKSLDDFFAYKNIENKFEEAEEKNQVVCKTSLLFRKAQNVSNVQLPTNATGDDIIQQNFESLQQYIREQEFEKMQSQVINRARKERRKSCCCKRCGVITKMQYNNQNLSNKIKQHEKDLRLKFPQTQQIIQELFAPSFQNVKQQQQQQLQQSPPSQNKQGTQLKRKESLFKPSNQKEAKQLQKELKEKEKENTRKEKEGKKEGRKEKGENYKDGGNRKEKGDKDGNKKDKGDKDKGNNNIDKEKDLEGEEKEQTMNQVNLIQFLNQQVEAMVAVRPKMRTFLRKKGDNNPDLQSQIQQQEQKQQQQQSKAELKNMFLKISDENNRKIEEISFNNQQNEDDEQDPHMGLNNLRIRVQTTVNQKTPERQKKAMQYYPTQTPKTTYKKMYLFDNLDSNDSYSSQQNVKQNESQLVKIQENRNNISKVGPRKQIVYQQQSSLQQMNQMAMKNFQRTYQNLENYVKSKTVIQSPESSVQKKSQYQEKFYAKTSSPNNSKFQMVQDRVVPLPKINKKHEEDIIQLLPKQKYLKQRKKKINISKIIQPQLQQVNTTLLNITKKQQQNHNMSTSYHNNHHNHSHNNHHHHYYMNSPKQAKFKTTDKTIMNKYVTASYQRFLRTNNKNYNLYTMNNSVE